MKNSMEISLKQTKIELPYEQTIPYLGIHPEKTVTEKIHTPQCSLQYY